MRPRDLNQRPLVHYRPLVHHVLLAIVLGYTVSVPAAEGPATRPAAAADVIDWDRARALYQREQRGEKLSPDEQVYLDRAKAERQGRGGGGRAAAAPAARASTGLVPLTVMKGGEKYKGFDGGLYGGGSNLPPEAHRAAAAREAAKVVPLDAEGKPAGDGRVVLLSIGMSNTTQEFSRFKQLADGDADKSPRLVIVDGAQGGQDAPRWSGGAAGVWEQADRRMKAAGVTPRQVQVVWLKQAVIAPARLGEFPAHAKALEKDLVAILNLAKGRYPNLRIAYLSSRIYAGHAVGPLNPEPYAYESAFSVRWVIEGQLRGDAALNFDPAKGDVKAPLVVWGPYLWADGVAGRAGDDLVYKREDLGADGTHPSNSGRQKVAEQLLGFFKADPTAGPWFVKGPLG